MIGLGTTGFSYPFAPYAPPNWVVNNAQMQQQATASANYYILARAMNGQELKDLDTRNAMLAQQYVPSWRKVPAWYADWSLQMAGEPLCNP